MWSTVRITFFLVLILGSSINGFSQYSDHSYSFLNYKEPSKTSQVSIDLMAGIKDSNEVHSPKKATIMSAVIPGLGQAYNEKYWKIGVIYAGLIGLGVGYKINSDSLKHYQSALNKRIDGDTSTIDTRYPLLSDNKVKQERDFYRTNRDRIILGFVALYALQILDANVDAHLREFDINDELSLRVDPDVSYIPLNGLRPTLQLTLSF